MATTKIKSKLTDEEKKKTQTLSKLAGVSKTPSLNESGTNNSLRAKSEAPVSYTKVKENENPKLYSDAIKSSAEDYFAPLLEAEEKEINNNLKSTLSPAVSQSSSSGGSGGLSYMPYIEDEEEPENSATTPKTLDELFSSLDAIEKNYEGKTDRDYYEDLIPEVKESLGLEKLENVEVDEDKIRREVEDNLSNVYSLKKEEAKNSTAREVESEKKAQENLIATAEANKAEITSIYDEAKIESSNQSLKRGLARSSIALLSINGLEEGKAKELSTLASNLSSALDESEKTIARLRDELASSLENLDIEYAIEVNEKIKSEVENLYKKQKEVIEFNNNVDKLEADYQTKRNSLLEDRRELEDELAEEYKGIATRTKEDEMEEAVLNYFLQMPKDEAINQLASNPKFIDYLGSSFYDVYYKLMRG